MLNESLEIMDILPKHSIWLYVLFLKVEKGYKIRSVLVIFSLIFSRNISGAKMSMFPDLLVIHLTDVSSHIHACQV